MSTQFCEEGWRVQVAEQLLRDYVFIHLERPGDKFNLLLAVSTR